MGGALVLGLDHVLLYALYEGLAAAGGTDAARAALNTQVLEQEALQAVIKSNGIHSCLLQSISQSSRVHNTVRLLRYDCHIISTELALEIGFQASVWYK